jgi:hypothetical protein
LRRQGPNESEEEDFPSNQDQVNQGNPGTSVPEAEGANHGLTQVKSTRAGAAEQVQSGIEDETAEGQRINNQHQASTIPKVTSRRTRTTGRLVTELKECTQGPKPKRQPW